MFSTKTSIFALAVVAGLSIGLAPQASFAQQQSMGGVASPNSPVGEMEKHLDDINKAGGKLNPAPSPSPTPAPPPAGGSSSGPSGFVTPAPAPAPTHELSWWEKLKLGLKLAWIMATSSSKDESKSEPSKVEQSKTSTPTITKTAAAAELKAVELRTTATKLVVPTEVQKPEINLNPVEHLKAKVNEPTETLTPTKLVLPEARKPAEINLNPVEKLKAKFQEAEAPMLKPAAKPAPVPTLKISTTVGRIEVNRPTVNVSRVVANIPRPVVVPHINIPVMVRR